MSLTPRTTRLLVLGTLAIYVGVLAFLLLRPNPVDGSAGLIDLHDLATPLWLLGLSEFDSFFIIQTALNVLLFMPFGAAFGTLLKPRPSFFWAAIVGFGASAVAELVQLLLADRTADIVDVIANGTGSLLGCAAAVFIRTTLRRPRPNARTLARASG